MAKKIFSLALGALLFCFAVVGAVRPVSADAGDFDVQLHTTYTISDNGNTTVNNEFQLTNKKATVFAKEYTLEVASTKLDAVRAVQAKAVVPVTVTTTATSTIIKATFPDNMVGEGKTRNFSIFYEQPDVATNNGTVLELAAPALPQAKNFSAQTVTFQVPKKYGPPVRTNPKPTTQQETNGTTTVLDFTPIEGKPITALFGDQQFYEYELQYSLDNTTGNAGIVQIALPPDTQFQRMQYTQLDPKPIDMERDQDGNWIATYQLDAAKHLDVKLNGNAALSLRPSTEISVVVPDDTFLSQQQYWETQSPEIQKIAQQLHTPKEIYDYVTQQLSYNFQKTADESITRLGAVGALKDPKNAACQEFTDLFIALARAAHIPARRATGFAYTANSQLRPVGFVKDVLHAWPEYYDAQQHIWTPVDPTWGNTTGGVDYFSQLDFNHIVFALNGVSSTLPYSAGAYAAQNAAGKSVDVRFSHQPPNIEPHFTVSVSKVPYLTSYFRNQYDVSITNDTGVARYAVPLTLTSNSSAVTFSPTQQAVDYILPFQTRHIIVSPQTANFFQHQPFTLTVSLQGLSSTHELSTGFSTQEAIITAVIATVLGGCVVLITLITRGLLVSRRK